MDTLVTDILKARRRIKQNVRHTTLEYSRVLSKLADNCNVYNKLECDQVTGSFKARGAFNKIMKLKEKGGAEKGVVTASSGNHGIGCLEACRAAGIPLTVFCRMGVDRGKKAILEEGGATVLLYGQDGVEAEIEARRYAQFRKGLTSDTGDVKIFKNGSMEEGTPFISPYNDLDIIAGQGTIGVEVMEDLPETDAILIPVGGGGLLSGVARYVKQVNPRVQIIACSAERSKVMHESIKAGKIIHEDSLDTLADGVSGGLEPGCVTFSLCKQYVDEWLVVPEEQIGKALVFMMKHHHKIVEGSSVLAAAAFMANPERFNNMHVVHLVCASNITLDTIRHVLQTFD